MDKLSLIELEPRNLPAAIVSIGSTVFVSESGSPPQLFGLQPFEDNFKANLNTTYIDHQYFAVAPANTGGPRVQIYQRSVTGYDKIQDFFAFEPEFRGGINLNFAYVDNDQKPDLVVAASIGGGPRVQIYLNTPNGFIKNADFFAFDPASRSGVSVAACRDTFILALESQNGSIAQRYTRGTKDIDTILPNPFTSLTYGSVLGNDPQIFTLNNQTLTVYDRDFHQQSQTTVFAPFNSIAIGGYSQISTTMLMATHADGSFVELDETLGIPLSYDTFKRPYNNTLSKVGNSQFPITTNTPPPDLTGLKPLEIPPYRQAIFDGFSIGTQAGTGTYTLSVLDKTDNTVVGLTNRHVVEPRTFNAPLGSPIFSPGPADATDTLNKIGVVKRKSDIEADDVDSALVTLFIDPAPNKLRMSYLDPYQQKFVTLVYDINYNPLIKAEIGDTIYKTGRTTGLTRGIDILNNFTSIIGYQDGVERAVEHQIVIEGDQFALPGDSGSLVFKFINGKVYWVAQLFAGNYAHAIVTPANTVLDKMNIGFI